MVHYLDKCIEHLLHIMGAWRSLGMALEAHGRGRPVADSLNGLVKQGNMRNLQTVRQRALFHRIAMILAGDMDLLGVHIQHGMIGPTVSKGHFENRGPAGQSQNLVSQANAENGDVMCQKCFGGLNSLGTCTGISGTIGQHNAMGM